MSLGVLLRDRAEAANTGGGWRFRGGHFLIANQRAESAATTTFTLRGFTDEFVEVAESWANPNYRPEHICYVDFIRIGAILEGILQVSDKSAALQTYMDKGVIESLDMFSDDEYNDMLNEVKAIFTE